MLLESGSFWYFLIDLFLGLKKILSKYNFQKIKNKLIFSLDLKNNRNSVSDLFKDLIKNSIPFYDVEIKKNNLEEIFLKLIDQ